MSTTEENKPRKPKPYEGKADYAFVSYNHRDSDKVWADIEQLKKAGVRIWYDEGLEYGADWLKQVEPHIAADNCKVVIFFISPSSLQSPSVFNEIEYVYEHQEGLKILPIHFDARMWSDICAETSTQMIAAGRGAEFFSWMPVTSQLFTDKTVCVMRPSGPDGPGSPDGPDGPGQAYFDEIMKALSGTTVVKRKTGSGLRKILCVGKNSPFTKAVFNGVETACAAKINLSQEAHMFSAGKGPDKKTVSQQMVDYLAKHAQDFDGFVIRPDGSVSDELFQLMKDITADERDVVLADIDLAPEQRASVDQRDFGFVGSDFSEGGRLLATAMASSIPRNRKQRSLVLLCDAGSFKPTFYLRTEAFKQELERRGIPVYSFVPTSMEAKDVSHEFAEFVRDGLASGAFSVRAKDVYLYTVTDAIAIELMPPTDPYGMRKLLAAASSISLIGYDGMRSNNFEKDDIASCGLPYLTADALPSSQGEASVTLMELLSNDETNNPFVLVNPSVRNHLTHDYRFPQPVSDKLADAQLFLFDLDGTLANTEPLHWEAYNVLLAAQGITLQPEDIIRYIGNAEIKIYQMIRDDYGAQIDDAAFLANRLRAYMNLVDTKGLDLFDYMLPLLQRHPDVPRALVTSQVPEIVAALLARWGLEEYFPEECRLNCHDGRMTKREIYENPTEFMPYAAIDDLSKVVLFEDAPHVLAMAQEVGVSVVGIVNTLNKGTIDVSAIIDTTNNRGLFIGLCGKDVVYYHPDTLPAEGQKMRTNTFATYIGGPAANAAVTFSMLGGDAVLLSCVGKSPEGKAIKEELARRNVDLIDMAYDCFDTPNISCIYINATTGERTIFSGQHPTDGAVLPNIEAVLSDVKFCLYDCNLNALVEPARATLAASVVPLVLDCGGYKVGMDEFISVATEVITSERLRDGQGRSIIDILEQEHDYPLELAAITRGANSIVYKDKDGNAGEIEPPASPHVVDTLGAGDIFHGAYCYFRFIEELPCAQALEKAAVVASYAVSYYGPARGVEEYLANAAKSDYPTDEQVE